MLVLWLLARTEVVAIGACLLQVLVLGLLQVLVLGLLQVLSLVCYRYWCLVTGIGA